jgi:hypothetical protein
MLAEADASVACEAKSWVELAKELRPDLERIAKEATSVHARLKAIELICHYAYGKPKQAIELSGALDVTPILLDLSDEPDEYDEPTRPVGRATKRDKLETELDRHVKRAKAEGKLKPRRKVDVAKVLEQTERLTKEGK